MTLTIEPGVKVVYTGAYEILVQGAVVVNGTSGDVIIFTSMTQGVSSGATIFKFIGTNLLLSQISNIKMEYAAWAIRVGEKRNTIREARIPVLLQHHTLI